MNKTTHLFCKKESNFRNYLLFDTFEFNAWEKNTRLYFIWTQVLDTSAGHELV